MPLIVTTPTVDPPAQRTTSTDGLLSAVADSAHAGVLLRANLTSSWGVADKFETNTNGWSAVTASTITRTTTAITGSGSLQWTRSSSTGVIRRFIPDLGPAPYDRVIAVWFNARSTSGEVYLTVNVGTGVDYPVGVTSTTARLFFAYAVIPANVPYYSNTLDIMADSAQGTTYTVIVDDVNVELQPPVQVWFYRDGEQMRGASPAKAADGVAYAYDYEASPGTATTWTCQPEYVVKGRYVLGTETEAVALVAPDLADDLNMSIKSLVEPDLSRKVIGKWPAATRSWEGRDSTSANPGATLMSGSWDLPVQQPETWVMETVTHEDALALEELLTSGPVLVQHQAARRRPNMYALVKTIACDYKISPTMPQRIWTVSFLPIQQPTPVGSALLVAGKSYGDLGRFGTYADVTAALVLYDQFLTPVSIDVGPGFGTTPWGIGGFSV